MYNVIFYGTNRCATHPRAVEGNSTKRRKVAASPRDDIRGRRERSQALVIDGVPSVLFNGASMPRLGGMGHTFTLAQAINGPIVLR